MNDLKTDPDKQKPHAIHKVEGTVSHFSVQSEEGAHQGSLRSYLIGFILSVILTVIPFMMVMSKSASPAVMLTTGVLLAIAQIIVHLICFLHMNGSSEERWNLVAFLFTVIIIAIVVLGSLWIMYHLNINMMVQ